MAHPESDVRWRRDAGVDNEADGAWEGPRESWRAAAGRLGIGEVVGDPPAPAPDLGWQMLLRPSFKEKRQKKSESYMLYQFLNYERLLD